MNQRPKNISTIPLVETEEKGQNYTQYFEKKQDVEIWRMFRQGHEGAFKYIYNSYLTTLFRYGCHFTNDSELIKDCIHDLFVELRQGRNISDTDSIKFYLLKALRWKIHQIIANKQKSTLLFRKAVIPQIGIEVSHETKLINAQYDKEALLKLNKSLNRLSERQKEALYHFYHQDLNYGQVADIMKLSNIKSARNLIYKAIDSLKTYFHHLK
jgi:RNA polymerase sigma factor (sigma-70 family)